MEKRDLWGYPTACRRRGVAAEDQGGFTFDGEL
jgi:hypothetical protein